MYHIVYKTTNLVTGHYYIGKHSTEHLNRNYYGSGKRLKRAMKKYGKQNFRIEHIFFAFTEEYAYQIEEELVSVSLLADDLCYNLRTGGMGGNKGISRPDEVREMISQKLKGRKLSDSHAEAINQSRKRGEEHHYYGKTRDGYTKQKISKSLTGAKRSKHSLEKQSSTMLGTGNHFYGKKHSEKAKEHQRLSNTKYIYTLKAPDGQIMETTELKKYCEDNSINIGQLRATGKAKGHQIIKRDAFGVR